jgi:hypothetical protein
MMRIVVIAGHQYGAVSIHHDVFTPTFLEVCKSTDLQDSLEIKVHPKNQILCLACHGGLFEHQIHATQKTSKHTRQCYMCHVQY